ncbi:protein polybromo-1-like [Pyrus ussuriensis x Pyrus communis]|uniref:Protein polybromo-1-like n=1 Tax=Pyrus ussuriensis x Pyrus communis TaxID=2448454 RepID=A0A5N5HZ10_9ROSA|nr:protein polybromo-1-like [Pyrus ussuriensis x Pyrus communis]
MTKPKAPRRTIDSHTVKPINKTIRKKVNKQTLRYIKIDTEDVVFGVVVVGEVEKTQVLRGACTA